jgi:4-diphosphocytidyl-2-C-methyl-D-erythritol kinase
MKVSKTNPDYDLSLRSHCKINLFLRITGRRENGFHDLASLFQTISLSDYMHFSLLPAGATKDELVCSDSSLEIDDSNLVIKALNLMREKSSIKDAYFKVRLDKVVPMQAGLGGGSGNAATAMYAFNKLTGFKHSLDELLLWAGDIGSDITFFFSTGTAYCTGRGEIIESLQPLPDCDNVKIHIFKPQEGLSTGLVFKTLDIESMCSTREPKELLDAFTEGGAVKAATYPIQGLVNDLESPAFICSPTLSKLKKDIVGNMGKGAVVMSGSGTSIYYLIPNRPLLETEENGLECLLRENAGLQYFECKFLNKEDSVEAWYE